MKAALQFWKRGHLARESWSQALTLISASTRDPRWRSPAYDPATQADQVQFAELENSWAQGMHALSDVVRAARASNLPPQLEQVPYMVTLKDHMPQLLIPRNAWRLSWIAAPILSTTNVSFSFGYPVVKTAGGIWQGFGLNPWFMEPNGSVSISDIYVMSTDAVPSNVQVLGYEGVLAIDGRHNNQSARHTK